MRKTFLVGMVLASAALTQVDSAAAQVRMDPNLGVATQNTTAVAFRHGGGFRGGHFRGGGGHGFRGSFRGRGGGRYYGGRGGYGVGAGIAGLAAGALIGGAIAASQSGYYAAPGYCASRFRSYDPASGTYLGYDGLRHPCP